MVPSLATLLAAGAGRFVKSNEAGVLTPLTAAVTAKSPACPLAVTAGAVATPLAPVAAVVVFLPANVPPGPLVGALKVTVTPLTGLP